MFKKIIEYYNGFDKITSLILKHGLNFCFLISIISTIIYYSQPLTKKVNSGII